MKTGHLVALVIWTMAVIFGADRLYTYAVSETQVTERTWMDAESFVSFRDPTQAKIGGCKLFRFQSLGDPAVVLTPKAETPSLDSRCTTVAYRLETQLIGKWQVRSYGATLVTAPQGPGSAITVERGEKDKKMLLVMTIFAAVCFWAGMTILIGSFLRRFPSLSR